MFAWLNPKNWRKKAAPVATEIPVVAEEPPEIDPIMSFAALLSADMNERIDELRSLEIESRGENLQHKYRARREEVEFWRDGLSARMGK